MRKKLLAVVVICLAMLLVVVGAYAYIQISNTQKTNSKTFNFFWQGPIAEKFNVTTFWMNVTFERENETHLIITVKTNHLRYNESYPVPEYLTPGLNASDFENITYGDMDYIGIAFSPEYWSKGLRYSAKGEAFEICYLSKYEDGQRFLRITHATALDGWGRHTCYFESGLGYTYVVPVEIKDLDNDLIHIENDWIVAVEFAFGTELIT